jgi:AraC family L-rhamnose operon regulatory protein RhaS
MVGRTTNDAADHRNTASKRQQLWLTRSGPHLRPCLPELYSLGRGSFATIYLDRAQRPASGAHYQLCAILRGTDEWHVAGRLCRVSPGTLLLAGPSHAVTPVAMRAPPGEVYWVTIDRHAAPSPGDEALDRYAPRLTQAPPGLPAAFERLLAEHRLDDEHRSWAARSALHCLIADALRACEALPRSIGPPSLSDAVARATAFIEDRLAEPLTVAALAAAVQLSPGQFHERFLGETGYTPADYWSRRRLARAKELLADRSLSITDVALTLGFSTSQYFATFFRRFTGSSPREYRRHDRVQG